MNPTIAKYRAEISRRRQHGGQTVLVKSDDLAALLDIVQRGIDINERAAIDTDHAIIPLAFFEQHAEALARLGAKP